MLKIFVIKIVTCIIINLRFRVRKPYRKSIKPKVSKEVNFGERGIKNKTNQERKSNTM